MPQLFDMLIYLRKRAGLTQQDLSAKTGLSRSAISMYETGKREPDLETLEIFADFYNVDMNTLTGTFSAEPAISPATRDILSILSDFTPEELALAKSRILKIRDSR